MPEFLGALTKNLLDPILVVVVLAIYFSTQKLVLLSRFAIAILGACALAAFSGWLSAVNTGTENLIELRSVVFTFIAFIGWFLILIGIGKLVAVVRKG